MRAENQRQIGLVAKFCWRLTPGQRKSNLGRIIHPAFAGTWPRRSGSQKVIGEGMQSGMERRTRS